MTEKRHTILCVDDEENIIHSLRRLLRKEGYRLLATSNGCQALELLGKNNIQVVICDQRMPQMSGTDFLAQVKELYPDTIRIVLTGYTDIDSIMESINKGNIYKFFLKPWNDQSLKMELKKALDQYDLIQANKRLHEKVLEQNEKLKGINERLEEMVQDRTKDLEIQNQALELSRAILEDLPIPIFGVSADGMLVLLNQKAQSIKIRGRSLEIGRGIHEYFENNLEEIVKETLSSNCKNTFCGYDLSGYKYDLDFIPLSGRFQGKGLILVFRRPQSEKCEIIS